MFSQRYLYLLHFGGDNFLKGYRTRAVQRRCAYGRIRTCGKVPQEVFGTRRSMDGTGRVVNSGAGRGWIRNHCVALTRARS
jgi:hypothetical protein